MAATQDAPGLVIWTHFEVEAVVDDYLVMLATEAAGQPYSKTEHNRALQVRMNGSRSKGAIEYKHENISAVMISLGLPYIRGYKPMGNYQTALEKEIQRRVDTDPALFASLRPAAATTAGGGTLGPRREAPASTREEPRGRHVDYGLLQEESRRRGALGEQLVVT